MREPLQPITQRASARRAPLPCALWLALSAAFAGPVHAADDLTSLGLEQLLQLTVVGASKYEQKQREVAAAVSVITRQEIKAFGWRTLDEALASLPGLYTTYDRQYVYLGARGLGLPGDYSKRVLVTIDGNRANDPGYDGGPVGQQLPLDMALIERIEFIPGPGGAVYGQNAMFGVVNVITRRGSDLDGAELALSYQRPQASRAGRLSWGKRLDNGADLLISVSAMRSRGEDRFYDYGDAGVSGVATGLDGECDQELLVRLAAGAWSFGLMHANRHKDDPAANYLTDPLVPGQYQADGYTLAQLAYEGRLSGTLQVSGRLFGGQERYRSTLSYEGTALSFPETSDWYGFEARALSIAVERHKLMLGLEVQDNVRYNQSILDAADPANDIYIPGSGYRAGLYAQDEWQVTDSLAATLGLRADRNSITGTHTSPRAALIWQASATTTVKGLFGRAHRAPNTLEHDYYDGVAFVANPELKGERIDTVEFIVDQRIGNDLTVRGAAYQWMLHDLITQVTDAASGLTQYQSGDTVKARGLELSADKTWASGARLRGSASSQNTAYALGGGLLNSPKLLGKANLSAPLPWAGLRAGYEVRYDSRRLSVDGSRLGGYAVSNLHLSTEALAKGVEVSLGIHNLFDKHYAQPGATTNWQNAIDQDGRSIRLQLTFAI
jgi:iron complex outermembrane receptor protein